MYKLFLVLTFSFLLILEANAKTLEQKKEELEKIYKTGAISKAEYKKAKKFLENPETQDKSIKKKKFNLKKRKAKKNKLNNKFQKKEEEKEEITLKKIEKFGEIVKFDDSYYPEGMRKKFKKCNNSFKCRGQEAGKFLWKAFSSPKSYSQRNPGEMIKAMAMFEVFYAEKLYDNKDAIERFKNDDYKKETKFIKEAKKLKLTLNTRKDKDEEELRSLIGINDGRKNMREALGMSLQTPTKEAIRNFWLLGEFLALGEGVKNKKLNKDLKERQKLLEAYKVQIANLKKKLKDDTEDEDDKTIE